MAVRVAVSCWQSVQKELVYEYVQTMILFKSTEWATFVLGGRTLSFTNM